MGARPRHSKLRSGKKHQEQTRGNFTVGFWKSRGPPGTPKSQLWQFLQSSWIEHGWEGLEVIAEGGSGRGAGTPRNRSEISPRESTPRSQPAASPRARRAAAPGRRPELGTLRPFIQALIRMWAPSSLHPGSADGKGRTAESSPRCSSSRLRGKATMG